jgi:hypothetical protein
MLGEAGLDAGTINRALAGFTDVVSLSLSDGSAGGAYNLELVLANAGGEAVTLRCLDVSELCISEFGGGLTQVLALRCTDVRANQLDRVALRFREIERGSIEFACSSAEVGVEG